MRFDILTLFPEMFQGPLTESILKRAQAAGRLEIRLHNIRDYATDRHRSADDYPYGGGAGMVMKPEPLARCLEAVLELPPEASAVEEPMGATGGDDRTAMAELVEAPDTPATGARPGGAGELEKAGEQRRTPVVLLTPAGRLFTQTQAQAWAELPRLVLVCGHYEGIDERFVERYVTDEVSIGDYVLTGGELGAMIVVDAVGRLVPGVLDSSSLGEESHDDGLLEYPHYTRPAEWRGMAIPPILTSGHHAQVARWRHEQRLLRTLQRRPDLLRQARLSDRDRALLRSWGWQE